MERVTSRALSNTYQQYTRHDRGHDAFQATFRAFRRSQRPKVPNELIIEMQTQLLEDLIEQNEMFKNRRICMTFGLSCFWHFGRTWASRRNMDVLCFLVFRRRTLVWEIWRSLILYSLESIGVQDFPNDVEVGQKMQARTIQALKNLTAQIRNTEVWKVKASQTCMAAVKTHQVGQLFVSSHSGLCCLQERGGELPKLAGMPLP